MTNPSGVLDASFIVRYLIGQPAEQAGRARDLIESNLTLGVTDLGIVESAYVLTTVYGVPREAVVDALVALLRRRNIRVLDAGQEYVLLGLLMCRASGRVSFGDAMVWAAARSRGVPVVYTFDERFPSEGIALLSGKTEGR
jgi:predicted nucleic acid-binding protein